MSVARTCAMLAVALSALLVSGCKWEKVEKTVGYRGPARQDPFLAMKRFLGEMEGEVEEADSFTGLPQTESVIVTSLQSFISYGDSGLALDWATNGGHLVVFLSDAEQWKNDYAETAIFDVFKTQEPDEEARRFLESLGIRGVNHTGTTDDVTVGPRKFAANMRNTINVETMPEDVDMTAGDRDEPALMSLPWGDGRVTLVASAEPFRNRYIGEKDHAALLLDLLKLDRFSDGVTFLNNVRVSFWKMLWERGWMALVALAVVLVFWLLKNIPRFGPAYVREERATREFAGHLQLTGAFLWRCREANALIEPVRREIHAVARRLGCDGGQLHARLAEISGLPEARVAAAVTVALPTDAHHFLRIAQDLQTIRQSL